MYQPGCRFKDCRSSIKIIDKLVFNLRISRSTTCFFLSFTALRVFLASHYSNLTLCAPKLPDVLLHWFESLLSRPIISSDLRGCKQEGRIKGFEDWSTRVKMFRKFNRAPVSKKIKLNETADTSIILEPENFNIFADTQTNI